MAYTSPTIPPSGITFAQSQASGASGHMEKLIAGMLASTSPPSAAPTVAANAGTSGSLLSPAAQYWVKVTETNGVGETTASPEAGPFAVAQQQQPSGTATVSVTGSGGTLTAGTYFGKFTYVDSALNAAGVHGETLPGVEFSFTQTSGAEPVITINDGGLPSWASGRNLYLTAAGGASGTEVLAFSGITGTTYTITANPSASSTLAPSVNTTTSNTPTVTFAALQTGNTAHNVYAGTASGAETCYARGITASTYNLTAAAPANSYAVPPPTANSTPLAWTDAAGAVHSRKLVALRAVEKGNLQQVWGNYAAARTAFERGEPVALADALTAVRELHTVAAAIATVCAEWGTLVDANPGHFTNVPTGIGGVKTVRQWP